MYQNNTPGKGNPNPNSLNPNINQYQYANLPPNNQGQYQQAPVNQPQLGVPQNRPVYTSMIAPQSNTGGSNKPAVGGFGKLESMGRVVREDPDPVIRVNEAPVPQTFNTANTNTLSFKSSQG